METENILTGFLAMSISSMQIYIGVKEIFNIVEMDRKMTVRKTRLRSIKCLIKIH